MRAERIKGKVAPEVRIGDQVVTLPIELPFVFVERVQKNDFRGALEVLLDGEAERFFATSPSISDLQALVVHLTEIYGLTATPDPTES